MNTGGSVRINLDTNVWISFLIGKRMRSLTELIVSEGVLLVFLKNYWKN